MWNMQTAWEEYLPILLKNKMETSSYLKVLQFNIIDTEEQNEDLLM